MQLLIILALLLYGSKSGSQKLLTEVKPVLESLGGEQIREAIKSAEEISAMLTAVSELTGANASGSIFGGGNQAPAAKTAANTPADAADDVGDAMTGLADAGRSAVTRGTSTTTFQRMLDNARVHDTDGVLADGENSRW